MAQRLRTIAAMGTLYLVRHGQASFGAANYDQLSPRGLEQAQRLGAYWRARGLRFDAVLTGTLQRHAQTLAGIGEALGPLPPAQAMPGLDEYDSLALIRAIHTAPLAKPDTPELFRQHFRILCDALAQWMGGTISPQGMPSWEDFSSGVHAALELVRRAHAGQNVLLVSSGGPISTAVGQVLGTSPEVTIALNMRIRNSAVTEFSISPKRLMLQTFNTLPHLDAPEHAALVTHA
jgi:broad specificity phosphatase PhoE